MSVKDITAAFTKASSVLNTGQLVKDEFFTLFEAVGALEIMDEKMDSGYLAPGETLDDDYDISRRLSPAEVVGIMDQLLSHEVAWHSGHPLSQTLFTSIYLDRMLWPVPKSLKEAKFDRSGMTEHKKEEEKEGDEEDGSKGQWNELVDLVLRAYCLALIKACDRINSKVCSEYFHEEEDFVTQLYNRNLLADVGSDPIQLILDDALSWLDRQKQEQSGAVDEPIREALVHRLLFRRELLSGLDVDTMPAKQRSIQPFLAALRHLGRIEKSMHLGKSVPEAFSWKIQRRLASTVPPRPMVHVSAADATAHMTRFCQDAVDVQQILEYRGPYNLQTFVWALQSRKPQPCAYIRSLVQSLIVNDMEILGSVDVKDFFFDSLAELVLPHNQLLDRRNEEVEAPSDSRFQIAKHMDNFVKKAAQPFVDTYRTTCLNRCRVRRTLCHAIVDWDALQAEAEDFDVHLCTLTLEPPIVLHGNEPTYSYPLSSWAYHEKLRQMRLILQLGFELSIYSPEEMPGMYWYLAHLSSTHLAHLDRIRSCVQAANQRTAPAPSRTQSQQRPETNTNTTAAEQHQRAFHKTLSLLHRLTTELVAIDAFAIALHALYVLLSRYQLLQSTYIASSTPSTQTHPQRQRPSYSSDHLRYELRMKPFLTISLPELVPFDAFEQESGLVGVSDADVLERASRAIAEAKRGVERCLMAGASLEVESNQAGSADGDGRDVPDEVPDEKERKRQPAKMDGKGKSAKPEPEPEPDPEPRPRLLQDDWTGDMKDSLRACIGASIAIGTVKKAISASAPAGASNPDGDENHRPKLNLSVDIPPVGSKGRWHDWWAVPRVTEVLPLRGSG
ncbi:amino-acid N-acetyltransferase subunit Mak10 [Histoplasma capsulatum G186AR]|uniref:Amino-acid N-acetyltransferase subunit Mak10 n=1 Tax=Ajellomyces capsulatus TaxID=5037 RepID=A0A8H8D135_AJECA|nr:amino-acid N-acetyltransferase subunit Mak10 [Histoplasma capsulatum]QSS73981.1 amino-acid N-acetyltransferase subunit Mak10 [Histoplasma capsulatum G186AR]